MAIHVTDHVNQIEASYEGVPGPLPSMVNPSSLSNEFEGIIYEFSISLWDERWDKLRYFDFGDLVAPSELEDNLGIDTGIVPSFWGDILMSDHIGSNGILAETKIYMRTRV